MGQIIRGVAQITGDAVSPGRIKASLSILPMNP
jgi:hypothetical protein